MSKEVQTSWIQYDSTTDFPIQNLPLGIYTKGDQSPHACTIIGDWVVDLFSLFSLSELSHYEIDGKQFDCRYINDIIGQGKIHTRLIRKALSEIFNIQQSEYAEIISPCLHPVNQVNLHVPIHIGDYTDFYSSREHATNVGIMFRDPANALLPNWLHLPVGYHGRASSIVISGTEIKRPNGQMIAKEGDPPVFGPTRQLDFELEMAFVVGKENKLGEPVDIQTAENHIYGLCIFNDWSARDIQKWEYVPLGPFLGKNFASSISPWMVDMDALQTFRIQGPEPEKTLLPYLVSDKPGNYDIRLDVFLKPEGQAEKLICRSNMKYLYWTMYQQLAHHTVNGCNLRVGDLCASGTISGPTPDSYGSMLELAWKGTKPIDMEDGTFRTFIENGDTVIMRAFAQGDGYRIGFGEVSGKVIP